MDDKSNMDIGGGKHGHETEWVSNLFEDGFKV